MYLICYDFMNIRGSQLTVNIFVGDTREIIFKVYSLDQFGEK